MIFRRYGDGDSVQSVAPNFDSRVLTEIDFREGENQLHFSITVHLPLRMGVYRKVGGSR
jgi:hypothetical protein